LVSTLSPPRSEVNLPSLAAGLEHALWGDLLFTLGLGWYFYTGSIG